jgi:hypothetical protein
MFDVLIVNVCWLRRPLDSLAGRLGPAWASWACSLGTFWVGVLVGILGPGVLVGILGLKGGAIVAPFPRWCGGHAYGGMVAVLRLPHAQCM